MKVVINEKECEWISDYPEGWMFNSRHYFKCPVAIGRSACFIKRFETESPHFISGWDLLVKLKGKNISNLPRTYDIVQVEENRKKVYYLFHEFIQGSTLESVIKDNRRINIPNLTHDLLSALLSVHKNDSWFPDLCEKNIFASENEHYFLIDLDSCQPVSTQPSNDMDVNMVYWALVYKFYKDIAGLDGLRVADIPGIALNHLQVIFLILHLKVFSLGDGQEYMSDQAFNELPSLLDALDPGFRSLFLKVLNKGADIRSPHTTADEIRELIADKIDKLEQWPPAAKEIMQSQPDMAELVPIEPVDKLPAPPAEPVAPEEIKPAPAKAEDVRIVYFVTNKEAVERGKVFTLSWEVEHADVLRLYRNGKLFSQPGSFQTSASISEPLEETQDEVHYELDAFNLQGSAESRTITIKLKEDNQPPTIIVQELQGLKHPRMRGLAIAATAVLAVITLSWFLVKKGPHRARVEITRFYPRSVSEKDMLVISGKNIPLNSGEVEVFFNRRKVSILHLTPTLISVSVPQMTELGKSRPDSILTTVSIVAQKDTIRMATPLTVRKKSLRSGVPGKS